jgi:class 3 adenylate cyclase
MFCDLVGSTSISAKLDAEEWHDLLRCLSRCRLGGGAGTTFTDRH